MRVYLSAGAWEEYITECRSMKDEQKESPWVLSFLGGGRAFFTAGLAVHQLKCKATVASTWIQFLELISVVDGQSLFDFPSEMVITDDDSMIPWPLKSPAFTQCTLNVSQKVWGWVATPNPLDDIHVSLYFPKRGKQICGVYMDTHGVPMGYP